MPSFLVPSATYRLQLNPQPDLRPFDHPRYWAAFILIGDPD